MLFLRQALRCLNRFEVHRHWAHFQIESPCMKEETDGPRCPWIRRVGFTQQPWHFPDSRRDCGLGPSEAPPSTLLLHFFPIWLCRSITPLNSHLERRRMPHCNMLKGLEQQGGNKLSNLFFAKNCHRYYEIWRGNEMDGHTQTGQTHAHTPHVYFHNTHLFSS